MNTLSPGGTDTLVLDSQLEGVGREQVVAGYFDTIPLGRIAGAVEVANAAVLAADQSSSVIGADLMVDVGLAPV